MTGKEIAAAKVRLLESGGLRAKVVRDAAMRTSARLKRRQQPVAEDAVGVGFIEDTHEEPEEVLEPTTPAVDLVPEPEPEPEPEPPTLAEQLSAAEAEVVAAKLAYAAAQQHAATCPPKDRIAAARRRAQAGGRRFLAWQRVRELKAQIANTRKKRG